MNSRQIIKERHRRWGTASIWMAEWWSNGVAFCQTPEGKSKFESWMFKRYGHRATQLIEVCYGPPIKQWSNATGNMGTILKAGAELGVAWELVQESHRFCASEKLCIPERTLPAPVRKRGEPSSVWLARRSESSLLGCKLPGIDWPKMRRIAYSEFDHVRDQMEVWRTQPDIYLESLLERAASTIISPGIPEGRRYSQSCEDAFRHRLEVSQIRYATWSQAASLFDQFELLDLGTATAVLRACQNDGDLLGRMVAMVIWSMRLAQSYRGTLPQALTNSEELKPYFSRTRGFDGISQIKTNQAYVRTHPLRTGTLESFLCTLLEHGTGPGMDIPAATLLRELNRIFERTPSERKKLNREAFNLLGDFAIVTEFCENFMMTAFGDALKTAVLDADRSGDTRNWFPYLSPIDRSKLSPEEKGRRGNTFGELDDTVWAVSETWSRGIWSINPQPGLDMLIHTRNYAQLYDGMWMAIDAALWRAAKELDRAPGKMAKLFGLVDPFNTSRPLYSERFLREQEVKAETQQKLAAVAPPPAPEPYVSGIPVATPQDSVAKAPARVDESGKKVKRKKAKGGSQSQTQTQSAEAAADSLDAETERKLPEFLPVSWKLNRKTVDIFHRLLGNEEKSGQLRWGDFEKAMTQVGFEINQTEGSSVRFDPPAKGVHPITFHRPHPDSTMTPNIMKWVGARLKRCYGWTADTFTRDPAKDD